MPAVILAAVATIGMEVIGGMTLSAALTSRAVWAKIAFSAVVSLVGQSLSRADTPQAPMAVEAQSRKQLVRASADPRRVVYGKVQVSGTLLYASNGTDKNYVHLVIALAGHSCHQIGDIWLGDELLGALDAGGNCTAGRFSGFVRIRKHLGAATQAADADLNAECPEWGAKNRPLKGIAYAYLRIKRSRDVFPNGLPTPRFELWGKNDILDPRTGLRGWQDNAALCSLDYILSPLGFNSAIDEVVQSTWIAAANVCDELVNLPGGGTQKRYTVNGSFTLDSVPVEVLDEMRCAMAGCASYSMGLWEGHAGAASAPVMDLSENDLRSSYKVRPRPSRARLYNAVKGTYISAADRWTETDFPAVTNPLYEGQDGNERIYKDVKLPFTTDPYAAQRIAKSDLERHRQGIVVEFPARIAGLKAKVWDVVRLSIAQQGWVQKQFRVVDKKISLFGGADLVLEEYSPAVYSWSTLDATTVDPAPDTYLPNPFVVAPPSGLTLTSGTTEPLVDSSGTLVGSIKVEWNASPDAFVRRYEVSWKKSADSAWQSQLTNNPVIWLSPGNNGIAYDVRVRSENFIGVCSEWATASAYTVTVSVARPAPVPYLFADGRRLTWDKPTDGHIAGYRIKFQYGNNADWSTASPLHEGLITATPFSLDVVPPGYITLMIRSVEGFVGRESETSATLYTKLEPTVLGDTPVANVVESINFTALGLPGAYTPPYAIYSPTWQLIGAREMEWISTVWTPSKAAPGSNMTVAWRIYGEGVSVQYSTSPYKIFYSEDISSFYGPDTDVFYGNPPEWKTWPGAVVVENRDYQWRVHAEAVTGSSPGTLNSGRIYAFTVSVDVPDKIVRLNDINLSAGGSRLTDAIGQFNTIQNVQLTLHGGSTAIMLEILDKSSTLGPLIKAKNAAGIGVNATIDVLLQGY